MQPPMCRSGNHKDQRGQPFTWCEPATTSLERVQSSPTFFPPFMMKKASRTAGEWCDPLPEMAGPSSRGPRGPSSGAGSPGNCPRAHHIGFKSPDICSLRCGPEIRQHNANAFPRSWLDGCQGKALPVPWDSYPLLVPKDSMPTCSRMLEARSSEVSETAFSALAGCPGICPSIDDSTGPRAWLAVAVWSQCGVSWSLAAVKGDGVRAPQLEDLHSER